MPNEQIIFYIKSNLSKGYSIESIRATLINSGYQPDVVDSSISQANSERYGGGGGFSQPANQPVNGQDGQGRQSQLSQYVTQMLMRGYSPEMIKSYLLNQGYPISEVQSAINSARSSPAEIKHTISFSGSTLLFLLLIFLFVGGVGFGSFKLFSGGGEPKLLDYSIAIDNKEVEQGSSVGFTDVFSNLGTKGSYDIFVQHRIQSVATKKDIDSWEETVAIDRLEKSNGMRKLPTGIEPGEYLLHGAITYDGKEAKAYELFRVVEDDSGQELPAKNNTKDDDEPGKEPDDELTCLDGIRNQGETKVDCGGPCPPCQTEEPTCLDGIRNQGETKVDCGGPCPPCIDTEPDTKDDDNETAQTINIDAASLDYDKITKVEAMGDSDPEESVKICESIIKDRSKNECFFMLSTKMLNSSEYCAKILSSDKRDACYLYFVNQKDYSVCGNITNSYMKRSCFALQQINNMSTGTSTMPTAYVVSDLQYSLPVNQSINLTANLTAPVANLTLNLSLNGSNTTSG